MEQKEQKDNTPDFVEEQPAETGTEQRKEIPTVEVIIKHHKQLFDLLNDPNKMWRVLLMLFLIIIVLFICLSGVIIVVKKYYPYSTIETNLQGATIMKSEDKEVIYWLFNTADLWANTGIEVEEGDELTIRASGASFTAIHHLVESSYYNEITSDTWVGTEGEQNKRNHRDSLRAQYRISTTSPEGILLMQVIPNKSDSLYQPYYLTNGNIEIIGKERRNLRISQAGVLRFAVNDIVLTDSVLHRMYAEYLHSLSQFKPNDLEFLSSLDTIIEECVKSFDLVCVRNNDNRTSIDNLLDTLTQRNKHLIGTISKNIVNDTLLRQCNCVRKDSCDSTGIKGCCSNRTKTCCCSGRKSCMSRKIWDEKIGLALGRYPVLKDGKRDTLYNAFPIVNELVYYKEHGMIDPWYKDNLGSFLIVIERKKK